MIEYLHSIKRLLSIVQYALIISAGIGTFEIYATATLTSAYSAPFADWSVTQLEENLEKIDARLNDLAQTTLRRDLGAIGYRSYNPNKPDATDWVKVDLGELQQIDEIVLVPTIARDSLHGFQADGFPSKFNIVGGSKEDTDGQIIASYDASVDMEPGISPSIFQIPQTHVSWIRIDATELTQRSADKAYCFQLAELMVFSGMKNVALSRPVQSATIHPATFRANHNQLIWLNEYLVDGATPYIMDSNDGKGSPAYLRRYGSGAKNTTFPILTVDLGKPKEISEIHLHTVDLSSTVPQTSLTDRGVPAKFRIEAAMQEDFADAKILVKYSRTSFTQLKPILSWQIPEDSYQYVRIVTESMTSPINTTRGSSFLGFAEIEILANNSNVALGKQFKYSSAIEEKAKKKTNERIKTLTDGQNAYGTILSTKEWMRQLAERHQLETVRPQILAELDLRYKKQKANIRLMAWLLAMTAALIGFIILLNRMARIKQTTQLKERFAADLHDELGANLHTISLFGDLAKNSLDSREELVELLERIREFTERSTQATRFCINMLETKGICEDLIHEVRRTASRIFADLNYELSFSGETELKTLQPQRRIDLFLFFKEASINIIRHSSATIVNIHIAADKRTVELSIADNGTGMLGATPPSLRRRARVMHAKVKTEILPEGGTRITLKLNRKRLLFLR